MTYTRASAAEIDRKLREDFRRRVRDFGISAEVTDPVLAVMFRTFAQQLEQLYTEAERIRTSIFDELISNLSVEPRLARPAQTVVRFPGRQDPEMIPAGVELIGATETGERLTFLTDATLIASGARIAFALGYQDGALRIFSGVEMPDALLALRPSLESVRVNLGPNPCIFLAIENLPPEHLSQHGLFFELGPDAHRIQQALEVETWCLLDSDGDLNASGILRPAAINRGIRALSWLLSDTDNSYVSKQPDEEVPLLPNGFYGSRTFQFPVIPGSRRFVSKVPRALAAVLARIFGHDSKRALSDERAWIRISMPHDIPPLDTSLGGIVLHATTASNVECFNETIVFDNHGTSIPIVREEGGAASFLVSPLSVLGEDGSPYLSEAEPSTKEDCGRYAIRNGRVELWPALRPDGSKQSYANLRLWVTSGALGNKLGPNKLSRFLKSSHTLLPQLLNPTSAAGGTDQEPLGKAQARFAYALLSRDRIVTRADFTNAVRSFDRRILTAEVEPGVRRTECGLKPFDRVAITVHRDDFVDPRIELPILRDDLLRHLTCRTPLNTDLAVDVREV